MMIATRLCVLATAIMPLTTARMHAQTDALIEEAKQGLRNSISKVKTLKANFTNRKTFPSQTVQAGQYKRSGLTERMHQENASGETRDRQVKNGICRSLLSVPVHTEKAVSQADIKPWQEGSDRSSAYSELNIDQSSSTGKICSYEEFLYSGNQPLRVTKTKLGDRDCLRVTITRIAKNGVKVEYIVWQDISLGYWIVKLDSLVDGRIECSVTVDRIDHFKGDITFPVHSKTEFFTNGKLDQSREFELTNVVINEPIQDSEFDLPLPRRGTLLTDRIKGVKGVMDSTWSIVGNANEFTVRPTQPESQSTGPVQVGKASDSEPRRVGDYLIYASVSLFGILLFRSIVRRLRAGRDNPKTVDNSSGSQ